LPEIKYPLSLAISSMGNFPHFMGKIFFPLKTSSDKLKQTYKNQKKKKKKKYDLKNMKIRIMGTYTSELWQFIENQYNFVHNLHRRKPV
jgi:hypothetical protein